MSQWWSFILMAVGILGLYLAGKKNLYGWAILIGAQFLWIAYALATKQWGFIISALAYGAVNLRNYLRWKKEKKILECQIS